MSKRILAGLFVVLIAGGFSVLGATYTYTDKWFGFITSSAELEKGYKITPEEVRKSVAEKSNARYVLFNELFNRLQLEPQDKAAQFAGRHVWVHGSIESDVYGTGPSVKRPSGGNTIKISSIEPTINNTSY